MWLRKTPSGKWHVVEGVAGANERTLCGVKLPLDLVGGIAYVDAHGNDGGSLAGHNVCKRCVAHLEATLATLNKAKAA